MRKNVLLKATSPCILAEAEAGRRAGELCIATQEASFLGVLSGGNGWALGAVGHIWLFLISSNLEAKPGKVISYSPGLTGLRQQLLCQEVTFS